MAQRKVIIACDKSPPSIYGLRWAAENLLKSNDRVIVIMIQSPLWERERVIGVLAAGGYVGPDLISGMEAQARREANAVRQTLLELCTESGIDPSHVEVLVEEGDPRDVIVSIAEREHPAAVVVGSRGLGLIKRVMVGSVSDYVVHNCIVCPVIVAHVPPTITEDHPKSPHIILRRITELAEENEREEAGERKQSI